MSPWWLLLIVPLASCFGAAFMALFVAGAREDERMERLRHVEDPAQYAVDQYIDGWDGEK